MSCKRCRGRSESSSSSRTARCCRRTRTSCRRSGIPRPKSSAGITRCSSNRPMRRAPTTASSGPSSDAASSMHASTSGSRKGGREIWIEASYNPVMKGGKVVKVVKVATDITAPKRQRRKISGKLDAISRAQAVIEFALDGTILTANENFCKALGYSLDEIEGRKHAMFVEAGLCPERRLSRVLGQARPRRVRQRRVQADRQGRQGGLHPSFLQPDLRRQRTGLQGREVRDAT